MHHGILWIICILVTIGILIRPFHISEAIWPVLGALALLLLRLLLPSEAFTGLLKGTDVYLFLTGMMLLAETAKEEKLFDWLAAHAANMAKGSAVRLFFLIYVVGLLVTTFLSNDATAVVLTPAVAAVMRAVDAKHPLPYLLICAFVANAASFILPISNPANLVIYGSHLPSLATWLSIYLFPSALTIIITCLLLFLSQQKTLKQTIHSSIPAPELTPSGKIAFGGIGFTAAVLLFSSASGWQLGLPTFMAGSLTAGLVLIRERKGPAKIIKGISWSILPLVGGLFIIVQAIEKAGILHQIGHILEQQATHAATSAAWQSGVVIAVGSNLINNLPAGLIASGALQLSHLPEIIRNATLLGVDIGPNLSVTGSLATILWLAELRREKQQVNALYFLKLGSWIMTISLLFALAALIYFH